MRAIKVYCPPGVEPPLYAFIDALDGKLKAKLLWQIFRLRNLSACELKEPHFKHFSLERYSQMYELREKGKGSISVHTVGHPAASGSYKQLRFSKGGHGVKKLIYRISAAIVVAGIIIMKRRTQRT